MDRLGRAISPDPAPDKWQADAFVSKWSSWKWNHVSVSKHQTLETETRFRFQKQNMNQKQHSQSLETETYSISSWHVMEEGSGMVEKSHLP